MKRPLVYVSITTPDGELLDRFAVVHYRTGRRLAATDDDDVENTGSHASNALLAMRIERYVAGPEATK